MVRNTPAVELEAIAKAKTRNFMTQSSFMSVGKNPDKPIYII
jgi:hypothetical protein